MFGLGDTIDTNSPVDITGIIVNSQPTLSAYALSNYAYKELPLGTVTADEYSNLIAANVSLDPQSPQMNVGNMQWWVLGGVLFGLIILGGSGKKGRR